MIILLIVVLYVLIHHFYFVVSTIFVISEYILKWLTNPPTNFPALDLMFSMLEFDFRVVNTDSGIHCWITSVWGDVVVSSAMFSSDLKGCLSSLIPLFTSHPSLSPPLRKAESKAPPSGSAELPPEYLTSPLSQQSQVIQWKLVMCLFWLQASPTVEYFKKMYRRFFLTSLDWPFTHLCSM